MSEAIELFHQDGVATGIFYCSACRVVHHTRDRAWECCNPKYCSSDDEFHCGKQLDRRYGGICGACDSAKRKAEMKRRLDDAELVEGYEGWVWSPSLGGRNDGFFDGIGDLIDFCEENDDDEEAPITIPEFVFCCEDSPPQRVEIGDVLEQMFADSFEDTQDQADGEHELTVALDTFWRKNEHIVSYSPDYKRKVRITTGERRDSMDAKENSRVAKKVNL